MLKVQLKTTPCVANSNTRLRGVDAHDIGNSDDVPRCISKDLTSL